MLSHKSAVVAVFVEKYIYSELPTVFYFFLILDMVKFYLLEQVPQFHSYTYFLICNTVQSSGLQTTTLT